jgi:U2-associated protein SR140
LNAFLNGPEKKEKKEALEIQSQRERSNTPTAPPQQTKSRWKTVEATPSVFDPKAQIVDEDVDGEPMVDEDVDGEPMVEDDDDVDGVPMVDDDDVDGEPMVEAPEEKVEEEKVEEKKPSLGFGGMTGFKMGGAAGATAGGPKRKRPKAEDMFADDYD